MKALIDKYHNFRPWEDWTWKVWLVVIITVPVFWPAFMYVLLGGINTDVFEGLLYLGIFLPFLYAALFTIL